MAEVPEEPADARTLLASLLRSTRELRNLVAHDPGKAPQEWQMLLDRMEAVSARPLGSPHALGRARKVSVSMPEGLTAAVQQRVGKGEFSHYVAEAVARQLELDLLAELAALLTAEYGPVPQELPAEAEAAWPDAE